MSANCHYFVREQRSLLTGTHGSFQLVHLFAEGQQYGRDAVALFDPEWFAVQGASRAQTPGVSLRLMGGSHMTFQFPVLLVVPVHTGG